MIEVNMITLSNWGQSDFSGAKMEPLKPREITLSVYADASKAFTRFSSASKNTSYQAPS